MALTLHGGSKLYPYAVCHLSRGEMHLSLVMAKPFFGISNQVRQKPAVQPHKMNERLEIKGLGSTGIVLSM